MSEQAQTPSGLGAVIRRAIERKLAGVHVSIPGKIVKYSDSDFRSDVQPLIKVGRTSDITGEREVESMPVVTEVPVLFPGSGGRRIKFPVTKGDTGLLIFSEASLDLWLAKGGEIDPGDDRRFSLSDAVFIPGLQAFPDTSDNTPIIEFTAGGEIHAGGSNSLATKADIDALITTFNSHTHTGVTTGGGTSGVVSASASAASGTSVLKGS